MKRLLLFWIPILLILFTCSLPNRLPEDHPEQGTASLSFYLSLPGEERDNPGARYISDAVSTIEVYLYRPFNEDTLLPGSVPTQADIDNLYYSDEVHEASLSVSGFTAVDYTMKELPLGTWNLVIGAFDQTESLWADSDLGNPGPDSFIVYQGLELKEGSNQIGLPLMVNMGTTVNTGSFLNVQNITADYSIDIAPADLSVTQLYGLVNFPSGEIQISSSLDSSVTTPVELNFYSSEGEQIVKETSGDWLYTPGAGNDMVLSVSAPDLSIAANQALRIVPELSGNTLTLSLSVHTYPAQLDISVDGFFLPQAAEIQVILYQSESITIEGPALETEVQNIRDTAVYLEATALYDGSTPVSLSIPGIDPGNWSLIAAAFDSQNSSWSESNAVSENIVPSAVSYANLSSLSLSTGSNNQDITLEANLERYPEKIFNIQTSYSALDYQALQWNSVDGDMFFYLNGFNTGDNLISITTQESLSSYWDSIDFYATDGSLLSLTESINAQTTSWTYDPASAGDTILVQISPNSSVLSALDLNLSYSGGFIFDLVLPLDLTVNVSGLILPDAARVGAILYQSYTGMPDFSSSAPTQADVDDIMANTVYYEQPSYGLSGESSFTLDFNNIDQAEWNLILGAFETGVNSWSETNAVDSSTVPSASTYDYLSAITLSSAEENAVNAVLQPNPERYPEKIINTKSIASVSWNGTDPYQLIYLTNFNAGSNTITMDTVEALSTYWESLQFIDMDGAVLDLGESRVGSQNSWTYDAASSTDTLLMLVDPNENNHSEMDLSLSYSTGLQMTLEVPVTITLNLDGFIMDDAAELKAFIYDSSLGGVFTTAPTDTDLEWTTGVVEENLADIKAGGTAGVNYFEFTQTLSGGESSITVTSPDLSSGSWNYVVGTFKEGQSGWTGYTGQELEVPIAQSFASSGPVNLTNGDVTQALTLAPNTDSGYYPQFFMADQQSSYSTSWNDDSSSYMTIWLTSFEAANPYNLFLTTDTALSDYWSNVEFYDLQGNLVTVSETPTDYTEYWETQWTYTAAAISDDLIMVITPNSNNYSSMNLMLNAEGAYYRYFDLVTYQDITVNLDGVLLPGDQAIGALLYDSFNTPIDGTIVNPSTPIQTTIDGYIASGYAQEFIYPKETITGNSIVLNDVMTGEYHMIVAQFDNLGYDGSNLYWDAGVLPSEATIFSPMSYEQQTNIATDPPMADLTFTLSPNLVRYYNSGQAYDASVGGQYYVEFYSSEDVPLMFITGASGLSTFETSWIENSSFNSHFSNIEFYDSNGTLISSRTNTMQANGEVESLWTIENTAASDTLYIALYPNTEFYSDTIYGYYRPIFDYNTNSLSFTGSTINAGPTATSSFGLIASPNEYDAQDAYMDVIVYREFPEDTLTAGTPPTQADIQNILDNALFVRTINWIQGISPYAFAGSGWNIIGANFDSSTVSSWESTVTDLDGINTLDIPYYTSYSFLTDQTILVDGSTEIPMTLELNTEKFLYETGGWGEDGDADAFMVNGVDDVYTTGELLEQQTYVFAVSNLTVGANVISLPGFYQAQEDNFDVALMQEDGTYIDYTPDNLMAEPWTMTYTATSSTEILYIIIDASLYTAEHMTFSIDGSSGITITLTQGGGA